MDKPHATKPKAVPTGLTMPKPRLKMWALSKFEALRACGIVKVPRDLCELVFNPPDHFHDVDSPLVQDILIEFQDEGLLHLVYYEHFYVRLKSIDEQKETATVHADVGRIKAMKDDRARIKEASRAKSEKK